MTEPTRPYELEFEKRPDYLYARVAADSADEPTAVEYWKAIIDKCRELGVKRLLVEQLIPTGMSMTDTFELATEIAAMEVFGIKIAFVDSYIEHADVNQFGEMVAGNRGVWAKVFTTIPEAENWLLQSQFHG